MIMCEVMYPALGRQAKQVTSATHAHQAASHKSLPSQNMNNSNSNGIETADKCMRGQNSKLTSIVCLALLSH